MKVLVDTSIWSLALRRKPQDLSPDQLILKTEMEQLITEGRASLLGIIRQEILSGIRDENTFNKIRLHLRDFPDIPVDTEVYEKAAAFNNSCKAAGISGTGIDFLICAAAHKHNMAIFTADKDFTNYARCLPVTLYDPGMMRQLH